MEQAIHLTLRLTQAPEVISTDDAQASVEAHLSHTIKAEQILGNMVATPLGNGQSLHTLRSCSVA